MIASYNQAILKNIINEKEKKMEEHLGSSVESIFTLILDLSS
jgi:hypothetical protein